MLLGRRNPRPLFEVFNANTDGLLIVEDVQLRQDQRIGSRHLNGVAGRHCVEPAASSRAAGRGAILASFRAQALPLIPIFPAEAAILDRCVPVYEDYPGWMESTVEAHSLDDLPPRAREYIGHLEHIIGKPAWIISTGPGREDTIEIHDPFSVPEERRV